MRPRQLTQIFTVLIATVFLLLGSVVFAQSTATPTPNPLALPAEVTTEPSPEFESTAEATEESGADSELTTEEPPIPTNTVQPVTPIPPEATAAAPEATTEATAEITPEVTPEATEQATEAPMLSVSATCTDSGVIFNVSNDGEAMSAPLEYTLDGVVAGSIQPGAGEQTAINAGYGQPAFQIAELTATADEPCLAPGTLSGQAWNDANGNGSLDGNEQGLADITVRALSSDGVTADALTDSEGSYSFGALTAGSYSVSVLPESLSTAFAVTFDADGTLDGQTEITIANGANSSANFGYREQIPSTLGGHVWFDGNRNGSFDSGESGVSGIGISLQSASGESASLTTDSNGHYSFDGIFEGQYTVAINAGTIPANTVLATSSAISFDAVMGQSREDFSFGLQPAASSSISGSVLEQFSSDTVFTISLYNAAGSLVASAQTGAGGSFGFGQLAAGQYIVRLNTDALPANVYLPVDDTDGGTDAAITITLDGTNAIGGLYFNLLISA